MEKLWTHQDQMESSRTNFDNETHLFNLKIKNIWHLALTLLSYIIVYSICFGRMVKTKTYEEKNTYKNFQFPMKIILPDNKNLPHPSERNRIDYYRCW